MSSWVVQNVSSLLLSLTGDCLAFCMQLEDKCKVTCCLPLLLTLKRFEISYCCQSVFIPVFVSLRTSRMRDVYCFSGVSISDSNFVLSFLDRHCCVKCPDRQDTAFHGILVCQILSHATDYLHLLYYTKNVTLHTGH